MEKKDLKEKVLTNLRSVTQSCKGGVPLTRLNRDYQDLLGSPIPFKELGFPHLEAFIRSIPHVISVRNNGGQLVAEGVADNTTAHIVSLVSRQRQSKPGKPGRKPMKRGGFSSRYSSRGGRSFQPFLSRSPSQPFLSRTSFPPSVKPKFVDNNHYKYSQPKPRVTNSTSTNSYKPYKPPGGAKYDLPPRFQRLQENGNKRIPNNIPSRKSPEIFRAASPGISEPQEKPSVIDARSFLFSSPSYIPEPTYPQEPPPCPIDDHPAPQRTIRPLRPKVDERQEKLQKLQNIENPVEYVQMYAEINELGEPVYQNQLMGQKKHNKGYTSVLKLGGKNYLSYPEIVKTESEAKLIAAQKAVESIKESEEFLTVLPETPLTTEEEVTTFLKNIEEIVIETPTGIFSHGVKKEYESKFEKTLPNNWIEKVKECSWLDVDQVHVAYGRVPDGKSYIIRPARNYSSGSTTPSEVSASVSISTSDIAMRKFDQPPLPKVPELIVPDGNEWPVYITYASKYIAARLIDFDEEYVEFLKSMSEFYCSHSLPVSEVIEKRVYALVDDARDGVLRVLVNQVIGSKVEVYYVDDGYYDHVPKSYLQDIHKDFLKFPFQAVLLCLDGLESFEPFMKPNHLEILSEKTLIAVVKRFRTLDEDLLPKHQGVHQRVFSVELFDTSEEEDVFLNDVLKHVVLNSWECTLPEEGVLVEGYMTHFEENGNVFIRFLDPCNSLLEIELEKLYGEFEETAATLPEVSQGEVFVAKFLDGRWYRAMLPEQPNSSDPETLTVFFIDYGHPSIVKKSEVSPLWQHSEFLASLGKQVIQCKLHKALPSPNLKWTDTAFTKLMELAPSDVQLFIRVVTEGNEQNLPEVSLHKRDSSNPNSPTIISINEKLSNSPHLFESDSSSSLPLNVPTNLKLFHNNTELLSDNYSNSATGVAEFSKMNEGIEWLTTPDMVKSPDSYDVVSPTPLRLPEVPDKGEMFDVFVTIAATPNNFIVQPLQYADNMNKLRVEMQQFYTTEENLIEMDLAMLRVNCFYAGLNPDGEWYRVRVVDIQENKDNVMAAVYYVDFGDFGTLSIQNLQLLGQRFRVLPCQAIKASLSGIKPIVGRDWNPIHCVKFKEMITEKNFVSIVKSKCLIKDQDFGCLELELVLIDTSDPVKDVNINDVLVEKSMAQRA